MLFNSAAFLIFFPLVTAMYFAVFHQYRWILLLVASCVFYMWFIPQYLLILLGLIVIDYWAAILIEDSKELGRKKYLISSIFATCLTLFVFKYFNFFSASFTQLAALLDLHYPPKVLGLILPIGLSFHTFQSLSYVIEVYWGRQKAERHFGIYALYVMFYPQLVAGPIERPQNLLHQFRERHFFDYARVVDGLKLMAWGMFKKVVIADRLASFVNLVYDDPTSYHGPMFVLATTFFAFQIYCDFSGYSDIAIGAAQVMGFRLMDNFNRPYFSKSIAEFWKRWHISLSSWFRDYIYIPLGGSRCGRWRWQANLFLTFLISGLWHGANWTYVVWGALNGFYLMFGIWTSGLRGKIRRMIGIDRFSRPLKAWQVLVTFSLVSFAWIFFRAKDLNEALYIVGQLSRGWGDLSSIHREFEKHSTFNGFETTPKGILFSIMLIVFLICVHLVQRHGTIRRMLADRPGWVRWSFYYVLVLGMIIFGQYGKSQFIYFQF
ncbi:MAG: MBOAT family protein [Candidatus Omnitrophica bacterium]|nr:MBOAT family protein [Candidatus Omnitrophota bacterium]